MKFFAVIFSLFINSANAQQLLKVEYQWQRNAVSNQYNKFSLVLDSTKSYFASNLSLSKKQTQFGNNFANHAELVDYSSKSITYQAIVHPGSVLTNFIDTPEFKNLVLVNDTSKTILGVTCKLVYFEDKKNNTYEVWFSDSTFAFGAPFCYFPLGLALEIRGNEKHFIAKKIAAIDGVIHNFKAEKIIILPKGYFIKKRKLE